MRSQYFSLTAILLVLAVADATDTRKFCNLWSAKDYDFDLVAVTDDSHYGEGREEDMALVRAFRKLGRKATRISIQDDDFDWTSTKMVVIRSAWGKYSYYEYYEEFQQEMNEIAILMNPIKILQWQADKAKYLAELRDAGINTIETIPLSLEDLKENHPNLGIEGIQEMLGCEDILMKPALGNGGIGVSRYPQDGKVWFLNTFRDTMRDGDTALLQCFQEQIETKGERGIVFVGGEVSHGILKQPEEGNYMVNTDFGGSWSIYEPSAEEILFAKNVASKVEHIVGEAPAYLRVDVINDNDDNLALMELAAGTADLWLARQPGSADLFARYLDRYLQDREMECELENDGARNGERESLAPAITAGSSLARE
jgi:glutathione synthase/RimK-type ligase-like ATP-grasp enzyme